MCVNGSDITIYLVYIPNTNRCSLQCADRSPPLHPHPLSQACTSHNHFLMIPVMLIRCLTVPRPLPAVRSALRLRGARGLSTALSSPYLKSVREAVENPEQFWAQHAQSLTWTKPWNKVKEEVEVGGAMQQNCAVFY